MENTTPLFIHTQSCCKFVRQQDFKDYYTCRRDFVGDQIVIRYSDEPSDYVQWDIDSLNSLFIKDFHYAQKILSLELFNEMKKNFK